jgi:hypothetical protein
VATVRLEFSPEPAHVRTVRLVGVAVARHQRLGLREAIEVSFTDGDRYLVKVVDRAAEAEQIDGEEQLAIDVSATLLQGLVKDLRMSPLESGAGTEVQMSWPVRKRR